MTSATSSRAGKRWRCCSPSRAERYERRSVVITSNLVFSEWQRIFQDPLTTAAVIDRVVHHSVILEFGAEVPSVRAEAAAQRQRQPDAASADAGQTEPNQ